MPETAHRVLAVLECLPSDGAVREHAVEVVSASGGYLTLVAVVPAVFPFNPGLHCAPRVTKVELRAQAAAALERAVALVPADIPLITALDEGRVADVIARRVESAAHDLVVVRRRRRAFHGWTRQPAAPVLDLV